MADIIMILPNPFHPDVRVYKEAQYLLSRGHRVRILALDCWEEFLDRPTETIDGIEVIRFFVRGPRADRLLKKSALARKMFRLPIYIAWYFRYIWHGLRLQHVDEQRRITHIHRPDAAR